jgi:hypothetical protein
MSSRFVAKWRLPHKIWLGIIMSVPAVLFSLRAEDTPSDRGVIVVPGMATPFGRPYLAPLLDEIGEAGEEISPESLANKIRVIEAGVATVPLTPDNFRDHTLKTNRLHELRLTRETLERWQSEPPDSLAVFCASENERTPGLAWMRGSNFEFDELRRIFAYLERQNDPAIRAKLKKVLDLRINSLPADPSSLVNQEGNSWEGKDFSGADDGRRNNYRARDACLLYAMRYLVTQNPADAASAREILRTFGKAYPGWKLWNREGDSFSQEDFAKYLTHGKDRGYWGGDNGLWGTWHYWEWSSMRPLFEAYQLIAPSLSFSESAEIQASIFDYARRLSEKFPYFSAHQNLLVLYLEGFIRAGLALQRQDYLQEARRLYQEHIERGFFPDGFWKELTPDYHMMVASPLCFLLPSLLDDVQGLPWKDGLFSTNKERLFEIFMAWKKTLLPNQTSAALGDSDANRLMRWAPTETKSEARLLGTSGCAILGTGEGESRTEVFLMFNGKHGHQHNDALGILLFSGDRELLSETTYRPVAGSNATREWSRSVHAHNTVAIDGTEQFARSRSVDAVIGSKIVPLWPDRGSARFNNGGTLLNFDSTLGTVQFAEASQENAYGESTEIYRRLLVLIKKQDVDLLVDIFRVRGGSMHEYMIHGSLDARDHAEAAGAESEPAAPVISKHLNSKNAWRADKDSKVIFKHEGAIRMITHLLSPGTGEQRKSRLILAEGEAIRRPGKADFLSVRSEGLNASARRNGTIFVTVHQIGGEGGEFDFRVRQNGQADSPVIVEISDKTGKDVILSGASENSLLSESGWKFRGRLGFGRIPKGWAKPSLLHLVDGRHLEFGDNGVSGTNLNGNVLSTDSVSRGSARNAITIPQNLSNLDVAPGALLHVRFGNDFSWSYRVTGAEGNKVFVDHDPGFTVTKNGAETTSFPGWRTSAPVTFVLQVPATVKLDEN